MTCFAESSGLWERDAERGRDMSWVKLVFPLAVSTLAPRRELAESSLKACNGGSDGFPGAAPTVQQMENRGLGTGIW